MNQEHKAQWIAALRSEKYNQTTNMLCETMELKPTMCCLGVACDISNKGEWQNIGEQWSYVVGNNVARYCLPDEIVEWLNDEFSFEFGMFTVNDKTTGLITCNDGGFTFDQIADIIEYFL